MITAVASLSWQHDTIITSFVFFAQYNGEVIPAWMFHLQHYLSEFDEPKAVM
jgi:hypothetical protein